MTTYELKDDDGIKLPEGAEEAAPTKVDFMESTVAYLSKMGGGVCVVVVPPTGLTPDESQQAVEICEKATKDTFYVAMNFRPDLELSRQVLDGIMGEVGNHVGAELAHRGYMLDPEAD
jgi:hypothetical protein